MAMFDSSSVQLIYHVHQKKKKKLQKSGKMLDKASHFVSFLNSFNRFNNIYAFKKIPSIHVLIC